MMTLVEFPRSERCKTAKSVVPFLEGATASLSMIAESALIR
jgi:hypothetical protein